MLSIALWAVLYVVWYGTKVTVLIEHCKILFVWRVTVYTRVLIPSYRVPAKVRTLKFIHTTNRRHHFAGKLLTAFLLWARGGAHFDLPTLYVGNGSVNVIESMHFHILNKSSALHKSGWCSGITLYTCSPHNRFDS